MRTLIAVLILAAPVLGDVVHLRSGGKVEGKVADRGDALEITTVNGTVTVAKDLVDRIEKKDFVVPPKPARPDVKLGASYAHPFLGLKLFLPPKWQKGKEHGAAALSFYGPKDQVYQPRMDLFIQTSKKDLADVVNTYKDAFRKQAKDVQFVFEEITAVRERQAYQFCVAFQDGDLPVVQKALFTFVADGDRKIVLGFNCSAAWFDRYQAAVDGSMKSLRLHPAPALSTEDRQRFLLRYNSGEQHYREGKMAESLADFQGAQALCPGFADLHSTIATILLRQNRIPESEASFRKAIEIDPDDANFRYNLGVLLLKQSKFDGAVESLRKATELEPTMETALTNLGAAYLGKDQNDLARKALERSVELDPESAPAHYNLGLAYERLDRKKDAEREYKEAISADPKHVDAPKALERLKGKK